MVLNAIVLNSVLLLVGVVILYVGGNWLVTGASAVALRLEISPLIIGLTVVAAGTSAPELFVSALSALRGNMGISLGNVLGSNVINVALILSLVGVVYPVTVSRAVARIDIPVMFGAYLLLFATAISFAGGAVWQGGVVGRGEGALLVGAITAYIVHLYRRSQRDESDPGVIGDVPADGATKPLAVSAVMVVGGIAALAGGAEALVRSASYLAIEVFAVSERFVGLTVVALGTSLPELVTTLIGLARRELDISVGNIVGSNIFNTLFVVGATAMIRPVEVGMTDYRGDVLFMLITSAILALPLLLSRRRTFGRPAGVALLLTYGAYIALLVGSRAV